MITRRRALLFLAAPAIVRAASLMPVRSFLAPAPATLLFTKGSSLVINSSAALNLGAKVTIGGREYTVVAVSNPHVGTVDRPVLL